MFSGRSQRGFLVPRYFRRENCTYSFPKFKRQAGPVVNAVHICCGRLDGEDPVTRHLDCRNIIFAKRISWDYYNILNYYHGETLSLVEGLTLWTLVREQFRTYS